MLMTPGATVKYFTVLYVNSTREFNAQLSPTHDSITSKTSFSYIDQIDE